MFEVTCPACYETVELPADAVVLGKASRCSHCWTLLEVTNKDPLTVVERQKDDANGLKKST